ncbi:hypothetical protein PACTADRAFT_48713 [Pachysolen tannophilus NRRL Y-2460]|uniref:HRDC domain-containing protein n=1 Tax=Pachysolen tannophilus NRRL Y-2460 TaxID=669874 RepID=A0A1E4TYW0_PACTA|nr:hypothetical protein PACTADRAFT_48713 [Pachysolen tannophilus NRRL Y-2460]
MSEEQSELVGDVLRKLLSTVRASSALAAQDVKFYKSLDTDLSSSIDNGSKRILNLINELMQNVEEGDVDTVKYGKENIEHSWRDISDVLDSLFEKSDIAFDDYKSSKLNSNEKEKFSYLEDLTMTDPTHKSTGKRIQKPQLEFKVPIDNSENHPFRPLLTSKPNSIVPFEDVFNLVPGTENEPEHYKHPYETEILQQDYPESILKIAEPVPSKSWEENRPVWIDTVEKLNEMIESLKSSTEIAVDLEHHDYRTYYGLVCLMQISNREKDWIIDTLALRNDLEVLNVIFTDPAIIKVFHGAFMDIIWLQRDLGLYVVSLFDSYHASRLLGLPKHSLAYLLEKFANFKTSKKYQLADWRVRPLSDAMMSYARSDTHFLLYIFDQLKNVLIKEDKLKEVLFNSRNVARRRFEYTKYRPDKPNNLVVSPLNEKTEPWGSMMYQYNLPLNTKPVVVALYEWRDKLARRDDESTRYVMPNQLLVSLAASCPTDAPGVLASSNFISDYVRINAREISQIIKRALEEAKEEDIEAMKGIEQNRYFTEEDPNKKIDFNFVNRIENDFKVLLAKNFSLKETENNLLSMNSKLFHQNMLLNNLKSPWSIEYDNDKVIINSMVEISGRHSKVCEALQGSEKQEILIRQLLAEKVNGIKEEEDEDQEEKILKKESQEKIKEPLLQEDKTDPNEVIVLRSKNKNNNNSKNNSNSKQQDTEQNVFDYRDGKKILSDKPSSSYRDKNKDKNKKRSFDPYSKESEGPKPAKKVSRVNNNRNVSFVNKRR